MPLTYLEPNAKFDFKILKNDSESLDKINPQIFLDFKKHRHHFASEINVISDTFFWAAYKAGEKLSELYDTLIESGEYFAIKGTFIHDDNIYFINKSINPSKSTFFRFERKGMLVHYESWTNPLDKEISFLSSIVSGHETEFKISIWVITMLGLFKKYAQVETKILLPMSKSVSPIGTKYINETKTSINLLNSTWFTTLVKSDAFNVRGHFRLQPKKRDGKWVREIIWISDFQKKGYKSEARIISANPKQINAQAKP